MRAVLLKEHGGADAPALAEVPRPDLPPDGVRIAVRATGVSFANLLVIEGRHQNTPPLPFIPGTEIAGEIVETGPEAPQSLVPGTRVAAGLPHGGFAEQAVAKGDNVFAIPDALGFAEATLFPTIYATAFAALDWRAGLRAGEVLLVHAAAGASGLAAVEIGHALGARVIATAGGPEKCAAAKLHGADHAIDYHAEDIRERVLELTGGRGADVVFDPVGGDVFDASLRCVAPLARLIPMGFASGRIPQIPANILLVKNLTVIGLYWGFYMGWGKTQADARLRDEVRAMFDRLFGMVENGQLSPRVDRVFPLEEFAMALARVRDRQSVGKVVLVP